MNRIASTSVSPTDCIESDAAWTLACAASDARPNQVLPSNIEARVRSQVPVTLSRLSATLRSSVARRPRASSSALATPSAALSSDSYIRQLAEGWTSDSYPSTALQADKTV